MWAALGLCGTVNMCDLKLPVNHLPQVSCLSTPSSPHSVSCLKFASQNLPPPALPLVDVAQSAPNCRMEIDECPYLTHKTCVVSIKIRLDLPVQSFHCHPPKGSLSPIFCLTYSAAFTDLILHCNLTTTIRNTRPSNIISNSLRFSISTSLSELFHFQIPPKKVSQATDFIHFASAFNVKHQKRKENIDVFPILCTTKFKRKL